MYALGREKIKKMNESIKSNELNPQKSQQIPIINQKSKEMILNKSKERNLSENKGSVTRDGNISESLYSDAQRRQQRTQEF